MPSVIAGSAVAGILPLAASGVGPGSPPSAGDLLAALRRATTQPEDYGAGGKLPEADTLSAELLAALSGPDGGLGAGSDLGAQATIPPGPLGIPGVMLDAYIRAEQALAVSNPRCGITWSVLAAIGRIESGHARGGAVDANGRTLSPILGPQLSGGPGMAAIRDTDNGLLDGDTVWDRAVGPMQFIPGTWARYAADGDDDGTASPHNVYDATRAAATYLCSTGEDLREPAALARAIFRYNHSDTYVANVLTWASAYASGVTPLPSSPAPPLPQPTTPPTTPPTDPTDPTTPPTSTTTTPPTTTTGPTTTTPVCPTPTTPPPSPPTSTSPTTTTPTTTTPVPPGCPTPTSTTTTPPTTTTAAPTTTAAETTNPPAGGTSSLESSTDTTTTDTTTGATGSTAGSTTDSPVTSTSLPAT